MLLHDDWSHLISGQPDGYPVPALPPVGSRDHHGVGWQVEAVTSELVINRGGGRREGMASIRMISEEEAVGPVKVIYEE